MKNEKKRGGCLKNILIGFIILIVLGSCAAIFGDDTDPEEKESSNPRSEVTDEEKAEMKREHDEKVKEEEKKAAEEERVAKEEAEKERIAKEEAEKEKAAAEEAEEERIAKEEAEKEKAAAEEAEKMAAVAEEEAKELEKKEEKDQATAENLYLEIMKDSVGSYVDIQFDKDNKIYTLTPIDQGLIDEISMLPAGIGHEEWGTLVDGMVTMSEGGKELVGEGYTMNLVNPQNEENIILWIVDGTVIYNVIDDL